MDGKLPYEAIPESNITGLPTHTRTLSRGIIIGKVHIYIFREVLQNTLSKVEYLFFYMSLNDKILLFALMLKDSSLKRLLPVRTT